MKTECAALGAEPVGGSAESLGQFLRTDKAHWGKIIQEKGIKPE